MDLIVTETHSVIICMSVLYSECNKQDTDGTIIFYFDYEKTGSHITTFCHRLIMFSSVTPMWIMF